MHISRTMKTEDSGASAKGAGLELSDREKPGITRKKIEIPAEKKGDKPTFSWDYFQPNGKKLTDKDRVESVSYTHLTLPTTPYV